MLTSDPLGFLLQFNYQDQAIIDSLSSTLSVKLGDKIITSSQYYLESKDASAAILRFQTTQAIPADTTLHCEINLPTSLAAGYIHLNLTASKKVARYVPLSPEATKTLNSATETANAVGKVSSGLFVISSFNSLSAVSILVAAFASELIQMYRFINVKYPANCLVVLNDSLSSPIAIAIPTDATAINSVKEALGIGVLIADGASLERYEVERYFFNNYYSFIITIILLLVLAGIFKLLRKLQRKCHKRVNYAVEKGFIFLSWNFTITVAFSSYIKLYFYSCIGLAYSDFDRGVGIANFILTIITLIISLALLGFVVRFLQKNKRDRPEEADRYGITDRFKCLYGDIKQDNVLQRYFIPIVVLRAVIGGILIATMRYETIPQIILLAILNTGFLVYVVIVRANENTVEMIAQIVSEFNVSGVTYSVLALACIDADNESNDNIRNRIGIGIIVQNFITIGTQLVVSGWGTFMALKIFIKGVINARRRRLTVMPVGKNDESHKENLKLFANGLHLEDLLASPDNHSKISLDLNKIASVNETIEPESSARSKDSTDYEGNRPMSILTEKILKNIRARSQIQAEAVESLATPRLDCKTGSNDLLKKTLVRTLYSKCEGNNQSIEHKIPVDAENCFQIK